MPEHRARLVIDPVAGEVRFGDLAEPCADLQQPRALLASYLRLVWRARDLPEGSRLRLPVDDLDVLSSWSGVGMVATAALLHDLSHDPALRGLPPPDPATRRDPPAGPPPASPPRPAPAPPIPPLRNFRPATGSDWSELLDDPFTALPAALDDWDPSAPLPGPAPVDPPERPTWPAPQPGLVRAVAAQAELGDDLDEAWQRWLVTVPIDERERILRATFGERRQLRRAVRGD